jgi:N6-L-threonylcarbamoyladenine synthase
MNILGIETSCDETSAAVVSDGLRILSNVTATQIAVHKKYGGVVPELASRSHITRIEQITQKALKDAQLRPEQLGGVAVTHGPGLIGSLLVGVMFAKGLATAWKLPVVGVNHIEAHLYANFMDFHQRLGYPYLGLVVSGGHTHLFVVEKLGMHRLIGRTVDDAAGEAFDKVGHLLDLGFPGGPAIERLAKNGDPHAVKFPRGMIRSGDYRFSFSGLKTAVARFVQREPDFSKADIAASFQEAVCDVLVQKTLLAAQREGIMQVAVGGGVSRNSELRTRFEKEGASIGIDVFFPSAQLCTDNAAMIAALGYHKLKGRMAPFDAQPNLGLVAEGSSRHAS